MFKYWLCIILWTFMPKTALAFETVNLELNDIIKHAREVQLKIVQTEQKQQKANNSETEHTAVEKLNPDKIIKQENKS